MKLRTLNTLMVGFALICAAGLQAAEAPKGKESAAKNDTMEVSVSPGIRYIWVKGDANRFRQDWWMNDKLSGGIESFKLQRALNDDWTLSLDGRAFFDEHDYQVRLEIANPKVGFFRTGYTEFRKYYDDSGGFYNFALVPPVTTNGPAFFALNQDLHVDIGRFWVDLGLTLPNWPQIVVGYERQMKDGTKSMIEWGTVTEILGRSSTARKIFPATKNLDETVDIVKVDVEHDIENVHLGNQFRYEKYNFNAFRVDDSNLYLPDSSPSGTVTVAESNNHHAFYNTFHAESHLNEKAYLSLAYFFGDVSGGGGSDMDTYLGGVRLLPPAVVVGRTDPRIPGRLLGTEKDWQTLAVDSDQNTHVLNVNGMFGPFFKKTTSIYGGLQGEKTDTDTRTDTQLFEGQAPDALGFNEAKNDKVLFQERLGVRFVGVPFTTLYAEGKWNQGNINLNQTEDFVPGLEDPTIANEISKRSVDTDITRQDYRIGFNTAPIAKATVSGYYRKNMRQNDYNDYTETVTEILTNGVVEAEIEDGYITRQSFDSDEVAAKLTLRPHAKLNVSFKYQYVSTRFDTEFGDAAANNQSGDYKSNIYSVSLGCSPMNRLFCTAMFSYQDTRTSSRLNGAPAVTDYRGDVYSVVAVAGYALDDKTDLQAEYSFSTARNRQDNIASVGMPYGSDYERHGVTVSLARQLRENIRVGLRYGYYNLNDRITNGNDNYSAHLLSGNCTIRF